MPSTDPATGPAAQEAAALLAWHGLGPEWIPETVTALRSLGIPELAVREQDVRAALTLHDVEAASCAAIMEASAPRCACDRNSPCRYPLCHTEGIR